MTIGPQIYQSLLGVRELMVQTSLLLRTGTELLAQSGWDCKDAANAVEGYGYSVSAPQKWMPEGAYQWYTATSKPDIAIFVAVLLCPREESPGVPRFVEPLVTTGWFRITKAFPKGWWSRRILWTNHPRDGSWYRSGPIEPGDDGVTELALMAWPLAEIASTDDLRTKVIEPLIGQLT